MRIDATAEVGRAIMNPITNPTSADPIANIQE